jgi:hypothetical protein
MAPSQLPMQPNMAPPTAAPAPVHGSATRNVQGVSYSRPETPAPCIATPLCIRAQTRVIPSPRRLGGRSQTIAPTPLGLAATDTPASRPATPASLPSHLRTPIHSRSPLRTRELISLAREHARASSIQPPTPTQTPIHDTLPSSPLPHSHSTLQPTDLGRPFGLPDLSSDPTYDTCTTDRSRPSTPVSYSDTDLDLVNFPPTTQPGTSRFLTIRLLPHQQVSPRSCRVPTLLDLRSNALSYYKVARRARRARRSAVDAPPPRVGMRTSTMSTDQKVVMHLMEHHMLWSIFTENPWPEGRSKLLKDAQEYTERISSISGPGIMTELFEDTVSLKFPFHFEHMLTQITGL